MEIIIVIAVLGVVAYWAYQTMNKEKSDGSHPLDGPTTPRTSWPFPGGEVGEGKIHVKVADVAPVAVEPVAPGKSEADRVEAPAPVVEQAPAKKAPAKKPAVKKPAAAKKAPAKKKSV
jgi:hypothetical protein